jgi:hypothetical protein
VGVTRSVLIISSFFIGLPWGIVGVAISYASMILITWIPSLWIVFRLVPGLRVGRLFKALFPYAAYSVVMAGAVFGLQWQMKLAGVNTWLILATCIPVGVAVYSAFVLVLRPPAMHDFLAIAPTFRRKSLRSPLLGERPDKDDAENESATGQNGQHESSVAPTLADKSQTGPR